MTENLESLKTRLDHLEKELLLGATRQSAKRIGELLLPDFFIEALPEEKRKNIFSAAITEFAEHGYLNASTNHIVNAAGKDEDSPISQTRRWG